MIFFSSFPQNALAFPGSIGYRFLHEQGGIERREAVFEEGNPHTPACSCGCAGDANKMIRFIPFLTLLMIPSGCGFTPPKDNNGKVPKTKVEEFLNAIESNNTKGAMNCLVPGSVAELNDSWYNGYSFERYCKQLNNYENYVLKPFKGKGDYWGVILSGNVKGFPPSEKWFFLKLVNGEWLIDEMEPHSSSGLPSANHQARKAFASFIIELVSPIIGHHHCSLFDHRDNVEVKSENYERALEHCSARVKTAAMDASSLKEFFSSGLPFLSEDVREPHYVVNENAPDEIRVILLYFKPREGEEAGFDYWTSWMVNTPNGWKCDFLICPSKNRNGNQARTPSPEKKFMFEGGDGLTRESAIVVRGATSLSYPIAEECWRRRYHPDWKQLSRVPVSAWRCTPDVKAHDDIDYMTPDGKKQRIYFDITEPLYMSPREAK